MKTLGGIPLPNGLEMQEAAHALGRKTVARQTLDGTPVVFAGAALQRVTLVAGDDYGWFDEAAKDALVALAAAADTAELVWNDIPYDVAFDHESGPAVLLTPLWPGALHYTGSITLIIL